MSHQQSNELLQFRVTPEQAAQLRESADKRGRTLSQEIRMRLFPEVDDELRALYRRTDAAIKHEAALNLDASRARILSQE